MAAKTVKVIVERDYWAAADEVFIEGKAVPAETRVLAGMDVDIVEKRAFALANDDVVKLVIPKD
jgi:hypothetical protein